MFITHNDEQYRTNIRDYLIHRAHAVRVDARGNLMNLAVISEDFYAAFLNVLFDLHLKNANADKSNTAGIDLIDPENRVTVQVSLTCAPETIRRKIRESIRKFDKPDEKVWQFYFVPITDEAPELKKDFSLPEGLKFDKDHDVLDIARLLTLASDRHKLKQLSQLVDEYYKKEHDYQELRDSLDRLLLETWKEHRSFKLMHTDDIDRRLFPGIKDSLQFEALGRKKENETESPVWSIIRESWKEPENHPIMIQGKGGIGKTVTLFSVTNMDKDILPAPAVYVPMFELVDKNGDIVNLTEFFYSYAPFSSLPKEQRKGICDLAVQPWNHGPSLLVLLDGFNEVPGDRRWDVLKMLQKWHTANMGAQLIAVSRPMDNLSLEHAFGDSTIAITLSELKKESVAKYLKSLNKENIRLPKPKSPAWDTIIYPLFLTLYIKSELLRNQQLWMDYPLLVQDVTGPGSLIWNYLQRELLRQEDEGWILRCALACEYIVPELAYRMLQKYDYTISQSEAISIIINNVSEMVLDRMPKHLSNLISWWKRQHFSMDLPYYLKEYNWSEFVLQETGLLSPYGESTEEPRYEFFHQSFRDCLAGLYLINQAELARESELPKVWQHGQSPLALDYAAELMDESTANRLWEINRTMMQYGLSNYVNDHSGTLALLELQKRKPLSKNLDFSGMDMRGLSLVRYLEEGEYALPLFRKAHYTHGTKLNCSTFQTEGHLSPISGILLLQDGNIISCSGDNTLKVWDPSTGQCLHTVEEYLGATSCLALLPDGRIVSGSNDHSLRVWDCSGRRCLQILEGHTAGIRCVVILSDGRIVSGSDDNSLRIWDSSDGRCLRTLMGHTAGIRCVVNLPDGRIVSSSIDGTQRIWDPSTGQCLNTIEVHSKRARCLVLLPNGNIVSDSDDNSLRVWNPSTGQCLQTMVGHSAMVSYVKVLPNGHIVSGSYDRTQRVWDPSTGQCLQVMIARSSIDVFSCVTVLPNGLIVSGSYDGSLKVWDSSTGQCLLTMVGHPRWVGCLVLLPDGNIVSGSYDGSLRVWNPLTGQCLQVMAGHSKAISCITHLPDGNIVSGSYDGSLRMWDSSNGRCLQTLVGRPHWIRCVATLSDGRIVSGSDDRSLRIWNPLDKQCVQYLEEHSHWICCVVVLPDDRIVSGSADNSLRVWNPSDGRCLQILEGHSASVSCVAALPDGRIVSGSDDNSLRVWNPSNGRCLQILEGHSASVSCVATLPDGRIVSGSADNSLRVWNPSDGRCLQILEGHSNRVSCVAILPDGRIVSGSGDNLYVWNSSTGQCLQILKGHSGGVSCTAVLSDGYFVSGSYDGIIKIWDMNIGECIESTEMTEVNVSRMDLSKAVLTKDLAKLLYQNGAKISQTDYDRYVRPSHQQKTL